MEQWISEMFSIFDSFVTMALVQAYHWNKFLFREIHVDHDDVYQPAVARGDERVGDGVETAHDELCHHPWQPRCLLCRPLKLPVLCYGTSPRDSQKAKHSLGELFKANLPEHRKKNPGAKVSVLMSKIGEEWRKLPAQKKVKSGRRLRYHMHQLFNRNQWLLNMRQRK